MENNFKAVFHHNDNVLIEAEAFEAYFNELVIYNNLNSTVFFQKIKELYTSYWQLMTELLREFKFTKIKAKNKSYCEEDYQNDYHNGFETESRVDFRADLEVDFGADRENELNAGSKNFVIKFSESEKKKIRQFSNKYYSLLRYNIQKFSCSDFILLSIFHIIKDENFFTQNTKEHSDVVLKYKSFILQHDLLILKKIMINICKMSLEIQSMAKQHNLDLDLIVLPDLLDDELLDSVYMGHKAAIQLHKHLKSYLLSDCQTNKEEPVFSSECIVKELESFHLAYAYGQFLFHQSFTWQDEQLVPLLTKRNFETVVLYDYSKQIAKLRENTELFVNNKMAENCLLYGVQGTGKSSAVASLVKRYSHELKIIELQNKDIKKLPQILRKLELLNIKFIVYFDDLSFNSMDDDYILFKSVLEGSLVAQPDNVLIYASSNRRHIIKESFTDTETALYAADVRSERMSLAERFGLKLRFAMPNQEEYLEVVKFIVNSMGVDYSKDELKAMEKAALQFASAAVNMNPRTAVKFVRQYVNGNRPS